MLFVLARRSPFNKVYLHLFVLAGASARAVIDARNLAMLENAVGGVLRLFFSRFPIAPIDDEECRDSSLAIETTHQEVCGNYRKRITRIAACVVWW